MLIDGKPRTFGNLMPYEQQQFLDYKLMIYVCKGKDKEKLDWFKTINIAGAVLTAQELRNAIYTGSWLTDAKRYFSKNGYVAYKTANKYLIGEMNCQAYLERAIKWIASRENIGIEEYMSAHQHDSNASTLWLYFNNVITWVQTIFPKYRKEMKGLEWGLLFNQYGNDALDPTTLETKISALMTDKEVTKKSGVYEYLLSGKEKFLSHANLMMTINELLMNSNRKFVRFAENTLILKKCTLIISRLGTQAERPFLRTCRCCAEIVI